MIENFELKIVNSVPKKTELAKYIVPPSGTRVKIFEFVAEAAYTNLSEIRIVWDYEGANEELLWVIRGSNVFTKVIIIDSQEVDGVKKLALVCDNGEKKDMNMAAIMVGVLES